MMKSQLRSIVFASIILLTESVMVVKAAPVSVSVAQQANVEVVKLENYRVELVITPSRGGSVTSFVDKMARAELVLQQPYSGLCMDHFQEQNWPGEFLEAPYEYKITKQDAQEVQVAVSRKASGIWHDKLANRKLSDILLEKTYTLSADSPVLSCTVKLTAPADEAKVFSYWLQNVFFAGGDYDAATDRTFRPSARGVRSTGAENNSHYGSEDWMRDFSAGWMALIDTKKKSGLAMMTDYNDLRINYANVGNHTNEFMFNTTYLPKGQSRAYTVHLCPVTGIAKVLSVSPQMIVGYSIQTDNHGKGKVDFQVQRSAVAVKSVGLHAIVLRY